MTYQRGSPRCNYQEYTDKSYTESSSTEDERKEVQKFLEHGLQVLENYGVVSGSYVGVHRRFCRNYQFNLTFDRFEVSVMTTPASFMMSLNNRMPVCLRFFFLRTEDNQC
jgi:hypothetical protein